MGSSPCGSVRIASRSSICAEGSECVTHVSGTSVTLDSGPNTRQGRGDSLSELETQDTSDTQRHDGDDAMKPKRKVREIVLRNGKPAAVILDIEEYQEILERLEDVEDLKLLKAMRKRTLNFRTLEDFLKEYIPSV